MSNLNKLKAALVEVHHAYEEAKEALDYLYHREDVDGVEVPLNSLFIREQACTALKGQLRDLEARVAEFQD